MDLEARIELRNERAGDEEELQGLRHKYPGGLGSHDYCGTLCRCYIDGCESRKCMSCGAQFEVGNRAVVTGVGLVCLPCWEGGYD